MSLVEDFIKAAQLGDLQGIKDCLAKGVDINATDEKGSSALIKAAMWERPKCVRYLVTHGADIEIKNQDGQTAYDYANYEFPNIEQRSIAEILKDAKQKLNEKKAKYNDFLKRLASLSVEEKINPAKNEEIIELAIIFGALADLFKDGKMTWEEQYKLYKQLKSELFKPENAKQKKAIQDIILVRQCTKTRK